MSGCEWVGVSDTHTPSHHVGTTIVGPVEVKDNGGVEFADKNVGDEDGDDDDDVMVWTVRASKHGSHTRTGDA